MAGEELLQATLSFPNRFSSLQGSGITLSLAYELLSMPVCSIGTLHVLTGFAPGFISSACLTLNSVIAGTHCLQKLLPALLVTWCLMTLSTGGGGNQIHNG